MKIAPTSHAQSNAQTGDINRVLIRKICTHTQTGYAAQEVMTEFPSERSLDSSTCRSQHVFSMLCWVEDHTIGMRGDNQIRRQFRQILGRHCQLRNLPPLRGIQCLQMSGLRIRQGLVATIRVCDKNVGVVHHLEARVRESATIRCECLCGTDREPNIVPVRGASHAE